MGYSGSGNPGGGFQGASDAEIASQCGRIEPLIDCAFETGPQVLGFAVDRLAAVTKMFFHKVRAVAYV